jgi:hypothetical protein
VLLKLRSNQDSRVRGALLLTLMDLKKIIVDLVRTIDRVMSKRRHRTVRTDLYLGLEMGRVETDWGRAGWGSWAGRVYLCTQPKTGGLGQSMQPNCHSLRPAPY